MANVTKAQTIGNQSDRDGGADDLLATFIAAAPRGSRRDLMRWGVVTGAAAAALRFGPAIAAPSPTSLMGAALAQSGDIETGVELTIPFNPFGQPVVLDPHRAVNWGAFWNLFPNVWGGLLRFDEMGKVQLDLAESFTVSEDGKTYTFKIRPDAKYATGNQVVAADFIASWKRALDPAALSPMNQFMQLVEGYQDYVSKASEQIGFSAPDPKTVEIKLTNPSSFFPSYLAAFVWSVVDPTVLGDGSDNGFPLKDGGTGPWRFTEFDATTQIVMEPNTNHYGGNSPSLAKLIFSIMEGQNADSDALDAYRADTVPLVDVPITLKAEVERDPDLSAELVNIEPSGSTRSLAMDFNQAPFDDVRIRQALAHAIDRTQFADTIWENTWTPATAFTPPVLTTLAGYELPDGLEFDLDGAKKLLEEAGFPEGQGLPEIVYFEPTEDTDDEKARWSTFFQGIRDATGIPISVDTTRPTDQILSMQQDNGGRQLDVVWWWNVAETPRLMVDAFHSTSPAMRGVFNWNADLEAQNETDPGADSATFDELVGRADAESDQDARNDLYQQAEMLALKNAVYIPIGNWVQSYLQKSWLQGTKQGPWTGRLPVWFDKDVVVIRQDS